jgi:sensor histidine kinase YesM
MVILFFLLLGEQLSNIYKDMISIEVKLLLIAFLFINISHRIEARDSRKGKPFWVTQSRLFVIGILSTLLGALVANLLMHESFGESYYWDGGFFGFQTLELAVIMITSLTFLLLWLLYRSREQESRERLKLKELELVKLNELKKTAELEALQSKVNPHFLYNSLSVISALIKESPDKAEKMTAALSRLFRYNINKENDPYSTISEELEIVKTFLEIEKYRFEERLEIKYAIDESCRTMKIPRFLLQPLVENSIKHGIAKEIGTGEIEVEVSSGKEAIWIRIYDSGPPFKDTNSQSGYGIKGSLDKLELLFPGKYSFELKNGEKKHVEIQIMN